MIDEEILYACVDLGYDAIIDLTHHRPIATKKLIETLRTLSFKMKQNNKLRVTENQNNIAKRLGYLSWQDIVEHSKFED